jgi:oligoendopeptidase F
MLMTIYSGIVQDGTIRTDEVEWTKKTQRSVMNTPGFEEYFSYPWTKIEPYYQQLQDQDLTEEILDDWMTTWSDLRKLVDERYARLSLATSLDTADVEAENQYHKFLEEVYNSTQSADQKLKEKLLSSGLKPRGMELALKKMQTHADLFREENLPLETAESKLGTEYNKIFGAQSVKWEGDELTLVQVKTAMLTTDREKRKQLWELLAARQLEDREAVNTLWVKFMDLRAQQAANADLSDYRAFCWKERLRLDYSPEDSKRFVQAIQDVVVPAATRTYQRYQARLGIETLRPWDLLDNQSTLSLPAIHAFDTEDELINIGEMIFNKIDPVLGEYFKTMRQKKLLDLMNRKGKAPGAFCTSFATLGVPFIFMNAAKKTEDLYTLFHETGHGFHVFERSKLPYHHQWRSNMEFNEVASMAMELLAEPYIGEEMGGFLSTRDAARTRLDNLEAALLFWPYMAVVVAFQHWVYENPHLGSDPAACDEKWGELIDTFMPGINWEGYEDVKNTGWHRKLHIHLVPFYYIEYGLAALGAFQIWRNALEDRPKAISDYRKALALGGTVSLPELYEAAGAQLAFEAETLESIVELIENTMHDLEKQLG